jgi:hypothetical protein
MHVTVLVLLGFFFFLRRWLSTTSNFVLLVFFVVPIIRIFRIKKYSLFGVLDFVIINSDACMSLFCTYITAGAS